MTSKIMVIIIVLVVSTIAGAGFAASLSGTISNLTANNNGSTHTGQANSGQPVDNSGTSTYSQHVTQGVGVTTRSQSSMSTPSNTTVEIITTAVPSANSNTSYEIFSVNGPPCVYNNCNLLNDPSNTQPQSYYNVSCGIEYEVLIQSPRLTSIPEYTLTGYSSVNYSESYSFWMRVYSGTHLIGNILSSGTVPANNLTFYSFIFNGCTKTPAKFSQEVTTTVIGIGEFGANYNFTSTSGQFTPIPVGFHFDMMGDVASNFYAVSCGTMYNITSLLYPESNASYPWTYSHIEIYSNSLATAPYPIGTYLGGLSPGNITAPVKYAIQFRAC